MRTSWRIKTNHVAKCTGIILIILLPIICFSQSDSIYASKLIKTDRLSIEYMDFGGEGIPLVVVQGVHNYFDHTLSNSYLQYTSKAWIEFYSRFTDQNHVFAPIKRGFGKTDPQLEVESVQSLTEDLLAWMNAVGIEKAYFLGRDISAQIMLYLAENHPDRILGLVFIQPLFVFTDIQDEDSDDFMYYNMTQSFSTAEYEKFKFKKSPLYRPEMIRDSTLTINVPALIFNYPPFSEETLEMRRIEGFINWVKNTKTIEWTKEYNSPEISRYFESLSKDENRMIQIRDYLRDNNPIPKMYTALKRAFGTNLVMFNESILKSNDNRTRLMNLYYPISKTFLFMTSEN